MTKSVLPFEADDACFALPAEIALADPFGAIDVGWGAPLAVLIDELTNVGDLVLDPFAGLATSPLVAATLGRRGMGVEHNPPRVALARSRLEQSGVPNADVDKMLVPGDARDLPLDGESVALVISSPPYFSPELGARVAAHQRPGQVYAIDDEGRWLDAMRDVLAECWRVLRWDGFIALFIKNQRRERGGLRPLAWWLGTALGEAFELLDERIVVYGDRRHAAKRAHETDRRHEMILLAQKKRPVDFVAVDQIRAVQRALAVDGIDALLIGSGALAEIAPALNALPVQDVDFVVDVTQLNRWAESMERQGFALTSWGEPVRTPFSQETRELLADRNYLRAVRGSLRVEATYSLEAASFADLARRRVSTAAGHAACLDDVLRLKRLRGSVRDRVVLRRAAR